MVRIVDLEKRLAVAGGEGLLQPDGQAEVKTEEAARHALGDRPDRRPAQRGDRNLRQEGSGARVPHRRPREAASPCVKRRPPAQMVMEIEVEEAFCHASRRTPRSRPCAATRTRPFAKKARAHGPHRRLEKRLAQAEEKRLSAQMVMEIKTEEASRTAQQVAQIEALHMTRPRPSPRRLRAHGTHHLEEAQARAAECRAAVGLRTGALQRVEESFKRESTIHAQKVMENMARIVDLEKRYL